MSEHDDGGPAYPRTFIDGHDETNGFRTPQNGMSLRDYFAGQALAGLVSSQMKYGGEIQQRLDADKKVADAGDTHESAREYVGRICYALADAMITARNL